MYITISEDNRIAIEELRDEVIQIKQEATELSISLLIQLKTVMFQLLLSYKEYSLTNIREYGLAEILMSRANRFFKLNPEDKRPKKSKEKTRSKFHFRIKSKTSIKKNNSKTELSKQIKSKAKSKTRIGHKFTIKKIILIIFFPFYMLILIFRMLLASESNGKSSKNAKNKYNPY